MNIIGLPFYQILLLFLSNYKYQYNDKLIYLNYQEHALHTISNDTIHAVNENLYFVCSTGRGALGRLKIFLSA